MKTPSPPLISDTSARGSSGGALDVVSAASGSDPASASSALSSLQAATRMAANGRAPHHRFRARRSAHHARGRSQVSRPLWHDVPTVTCRARVRVRIPSAAVDADPLPTLAVRDDV
jgi:hypothetical protein